MSSGPPPDQLLKVHAQRLGDPVQHQGRRVSPAAFDAAQIGLMHLGAVGELLLAEAAVSPQPLQIEANSHPHVHARMAGRDLTSAHRL